MTARRWCCASLLCLLSLTVHAAEPPTLPSTLRGASLFKNGLAMVLREAVAPGAGEFLLADLPAPIHGTFWLVPPAGVRLTCTALPLTRRDSVQATNLIELLRANLGRQVEVKLDNAWVKATLMSLPERTPNVPMRVARRGPFEEAYPGGPAYDSGAGFVLLQTAEGLTAINPAEIRGLRAAELQTRFERPQTSPALRVSVSAAGPVQIAYLAWGLTWAPSYRIDVRDEEATVDLKAAVLNDIEELSQTNLSFITGFPNLKFSAVVDPSALQGDVATFINSLSNPERSSGGRGGMMAQQMVMANSYAPDDTPAMGVPYTPTVGEQAEDLFFYPLPGVTLGRGQRGYFPLFAATVPCRSLYCWDVPDAVDEQSRWRRDRDDTKAAPPEVWQVLRLTNTGQVPWTTAPALIVKADKILGQVPMFYTGVGSSTEVKVTRAVDVPCSAGQTITATQHNALNLEGWSYTRFTVKGSLVLTNRKARPITVAVSKQLSGEVKETTPTAADVAVAAGLNPVNPVHRLTWSVTVAPGERKELVYVYSVFVRQ